MDDAGARQLVQRRVAMQQRVDQGAGRVAGAGWTTSQPACRGRTCSSSLSTSSGMSSATAWVCTSSTAFRDDGFAAMGPGRAAPARRPQVTCPALIQADSREREYSGTARRGRRRATPAAAAGTGAVAGVGAVMAGKSRPGGTGDGVGRRLKRDWYYRPSCPGARSMPMTPRTPRCRPPDRPAARRGRPPRQLRQGHVQGQGQERRAAGQPSCTTRHTGIWRTAAGQRRGSLAPVDRAVPGTALHRTSADGTGLCRSTRRAALRRGVQRRPLHPHLPDPQEHRLPSTTCAASPT